ncbi:MAG TPA: hypothetical protein VF462_08580 [Micromonosporaceae bacterium]
MNLTYLKQVLDERSGDSAENVMHHLRLQGVRAKVAARRRRRVASATFAVVALAGIATAAVVPALRSDVARTPAAGPPPTRTVEGFPEYANGARVVGAQSAELPERGVELTIVPTTLDLVVFTRCEGTGEKVHLAETVTVNGHDLLGGTCGTIVRPEGWAGLGVAVGKPATFVMTITGAQRLEETGDVQVPIPQTGAFGLAIGERIPFDQYPLPPRPAALRPLDQTLPVRCTEARCPGALLIRSDPADPTRPVRQTVTWKTIEAIDLVAQTPGLLHVRANGVEVATGEWWDYEVGGSGTYGDQDGDWKRAFGLDLRPGASVTIEIVPEHITGAWQVVFTPARTGKGR